MMLSSRFVLFALIVGMGLPLGLWAQEEQETPKVEDPPHIVLNREAVALYEKKDYPAAIKKFEEALAILTKAKKSELGTTIVSNLVLSHTAIVRSDIDTKNYDKAEKRLYKVAKLAPKSAELPLWRGILRYRQGYAAAAVDELSEAIRRNPKSASAHYYIGRLHYDREALELAVVAWEEAVSLEPRYKKDLGAWIKKAKRELAIEAGMLTERSTHFVCKYSAKTGRGTASTILDWLEESYVEVGQRLQVYPEKNLTVILYSDREFSAATGAHSWVAGLFDGKVRIPVKNFEVRQRALKATLAHEYTHYAVRRLTRRCPAWLNEGLAQIAEGGDARRQDRKLGRLARSGKLIPLKQLVRSFVTISERSRVSLAYAQSQSFVAYIIRTYTIRDVESVLRRSAKVKDFSAAFRAVFREKLEQVFEDWKSALPTN